MFTLYTTHVYFFVFLYSFQGFCEAVIPLVMNPAHFKAIISCITAVIPMSSLPNSVCFVNLFFPFLVDRTATQYDRLLA